MKDNNCTKEGTIQALDSSDRIANAQKTLLRCLMYGGGEPFDLDHTKFVSQDNSIREPENVPGLFIVDVKRYRVASVCLYRGKPAMAACEAYIQELFFEPETGNLVEHGEVHIEYNYWARAIADEQMLEYRPTVLTCEDLGDKRRVSLDICKLNIEVSSHEEAARLLEAEIRSMDHGFTFEFIEMSSEEKDCSSIVLEEACVDIVLERLDEAWKNPKPLEK